MLHLLAPGQHDPPENVRQAAGALRLLPWGMPADAPTREYGPEVITFVGSADEDVRGILQPLADLAIPAVGLGIRRLDVLAAGVNANIAAADLRVVLNLVVALAAERRFNPAMAPKTANTVAVAVDDLILLLEHLLTLRIPDYRERALRVMEASLWICNHLNLPPEEIRDIVRASRLREIGKLGVSDRLLFARRVERTSEEQTAYNRYPEFGANALNHLPVLRTIANIVEHQLENFDGSGPRGLMAHQIPLGSRILRAAGTFTMLQSSPDKPAAPRDVVAALERGRGTLYDPLLVKLIENYLVAGTDDVSESSARWVRLTELEEGMVVAEDIWSRTGMKIIPRGTRLTSHILKILQQFPIHPSIDSVRVHP